MAHKSTNLDSKKYDNATLYGSIVFFLHQHLTLSQVFNNHYPAILRSMAYDMRLDKFYTSKCAHTFQIY